MKRLCWIFLTLIMICGLTTWAMSAEPCDDTLTWTLDDTGTLTVSGTGKMYDYDKDEYAWGEIPWASSKDKIRKIIFENGITHIGSYTFQECKNITEVSFPATLQTIGFNAFYSCTALTEITFPEAITTIGDQAFKNCSSLVKATFLGNAPTIYPYSSFENTNTNFTIYYYEDKTGWNSTLLQEYKTESLGKSSTSPTSSDYHVTLSSNVSAATVGDTITVKITSDKTFAAAEITVNYDNTCMMLDTEVAASNGADINDSQGTLTLTDYGAEQSEYTLVFQATAPGDTAITLSSAKLSSASDAATSDLKSAVISAGTVSVKINKSSHEVSLPEHLTGDPSVVHNGTYTFSIADTDKEYYTYSITASMDGTPATVLLNDDGTYTIEQVTGTLVITASRTLKTDIQVQQYLTLPENALWLVTNTAEKIDGKIYSCDGTPMYWSDKYNAYCILILSSVSPSVSAENLSLEDGAVQTIAYTDDVNMSGKVDANDAQFVYNMYNCYYPGFTDSVTMEKYLRGDTNGDKVISVLDAAFIIRNLRNPS